MGGYTVSDCFKMGAVWAVAGGLFAAILTRGFLPPILVVAAFIVGFLAVMYLAYIGCGKGAVGAAKPAPQPPAADRDKAEPKPKVDAPPRQPVATLSDAGAAAAPPKQPPAENSAAVSPEVLTAPRGGVADDLKKINGVGPKLEGLLNSLGVYHFSQIASWSEAEVEWVDDKLNFKGRISRDGWVDQAKALAGNATG